MRWPASQGSSSRASGTRVVLPAPAGFQNGLVLCAKGLAQGGNNGVDG